MSALLNYSDLERQQNITLSSDGQTLANAIADGILAWAQRVTGRVFTPGTVIDTFDDGGSLFYLSQANIDLTAPVTLSTYNSATNSYDAYAGTLRVDPTGVVKANDAFLRGYQSVKINYSTGYTTLPNDLKQALTELLAIRFLAAAPQGTDDDGDADGDGTGPIKRVSVGGYSEEYALPATITASESYANLKGVPASVLEVVNSYVLVRVY